MLNRWSQSGQRPCLVEVGWSWRGCRLILNFFLMHTPIIVKFKAIWRTFLSLSKCRRPRLKMQSFGKKWTLTTRKSTAKNIFIVMLFLHTLCRLWHQLTVFLEAHVHHAMFQVDGLFLVISIMLFMLILIMSSCTSSSSPNSKTGAEFIVSYSKISESINCRWSNCCLKLPNSFQVRDTVSLLTISDAATSVQFLSGFKEKVGSFSNRFLIIYRQKRTTRRICCSSLRLLNLACLITTLLPPRFDSLSHSKLLVIWVYFEF